MTGVLGLQWQQRQQSVRGDGPRLKRMPEPCETLEHRTCIGRLSALGSNRADAAQPPSRPP